MPTAEIQSLLAKARNQVPVASCWLHYKGGTYCVDGHSFDSERETINIQYHRVGGPNFSGSAEAGIVYSRPVTEWFDRVKLNGGPATSQRFARIGR